MSGFEDVKIEGNRITLPCGCYRAVETVQAPDFVDDPSSNEHGQAKLNEKGEFVMKDQEEVVERFCAEHQAVIAERQQAVKRALESGASPEDAQKILAGATPFQALEAHFEKLVDEADEPKLVSASDEPPKA